MSTAWSRQIGVAIKAARESAGLKWVGLDTKTRDLGVPVHRVALRNIEDGQRDITVSELVAVAAALNVPPMRLLFPNILELVEVLPDVELTGVDALAAFIGISASPDSRALFGEGDDAMVIAIEIVEILKSVRKQLDNRARNQRALELEEASGSLSAAKRKHRTDTIDHYRRQIDLLIEELNRLAAVYQEQVRAQSYTGEPDLYELVDGQLRRLDDDDPRRQQIEKDDDA